MASTGMIIDGVLGSQCVDSSGEVLDIDGADIQDLEEGRGVLNYEHKGAEDKDSNGQEIVGKIITAKKIFKEGDCDNARQRAFWKKVKHPFIYGVCRLYDGAGHEGAKALAAQIRDHFANSEPILVRFSVEGSTLEKEGNVLKRSVIRRVALTLKPCNRTADSGLLEDPNAPKGFETKPTGRVGDILADLADAQKSEHEHPLFQKLGGITETEYVEFEESDHRQLIKALAKLKAVKKALTAGSGDVAPSQLSGGAALQREDIVRFKAKAMKTLKSFLDKNEDFTRAEAIETLKRELPEASDEYINHFADIAEDYKLKLRKDEPQAPKAKTITPEADPFPKEDPNLKGVQQTRVDRASEPKGALPASRKGAMEMKPGGKLLIQRKGAGKGSSRLSLQQHFPDDDDYHALLKPEEALDSGKIDHETYQNIVKTVHEPWHRAMANWMPMNKALSEGKVPKGILAKSVIFAAMSPNTSVPLQERYYGHYMDMLNEGKVDPFKPISEDSIKEFTERSVNGQDPIWNRDYYAAHPLGVNAGGENMEGREDIGDLPQIMGLRNAHKLYPYLEHLTAKHKDDTQGIAGELMDMKHEHNQYKSKTDIDRRQGRTHIQRTAPEHERTLGYGPKLTRYLLGMMGGGNMIVPDRHMVRSTFDLHMNDDADILEKLQTGVVTKAHNEPFLRAIDHNFFTKHPAVKHVLETFPKHFQGREQQAIFPAFWLHWLTIGHHDRMRGRPSMAFNADTDHRVFWDSVKDEMVKHGIHPHPLHDKRPKMLDEDTSFDFGHNLAKGEDGKPLDPWPRHPNHLDHPVWLKAAGVVQALRQRWGENAALMAFFSHIAPHVMAAETPVPPVQHAPHSSYHPHLVKAEALMIDLKKALAGEKDHPALDEVAPHIHHVYALRPGPDLKIKRHIAGRFLTAGNHLHVLEDHHGHLKGALSEGPMDQWKAQQIENLRNNHKFEVVPLSDIRSGKRPELWEPAPAPTKQPASFEFTRQGQEKSDHLEFKAGQAHLNGHPLDHEQTKALLHHVGNGHATVRYKAGRENAIQKMELVLEELMKNADPAQATAIHEALGKIDELVKAGHLEPHHAEALRQHAFKDPMTGHVMGNKFAYTDFLNRNGNNHEGVHMVMDGNDFKSVNDKFGHETGDQGIKAMGKAMREAMDEAVGSDKGKLFRTGGDEFAAHVPTHEHAAAFARALRSKLEAIQPIQGTHKLSMGIGMGHTPGHADKALYEAKKQKYDPEGMTHPDSRKWVSKYSPGTAPNFAHSLMPGFEGPVPLDRSQLHVKPPPMPQPVPEAPAPVVHTPSAPSPSPAAHVAAKPA